MREESASKGNILVIEDDRDFSALIASILTDRGYEVTLAYTCEQALVKIRDRVPDAITLDLQMPRTQRKSGLHFYRQIKSAEAFMRVPVVVVTGIMRDDRDMQNLVRSFLETDRVPPPDAYIDKPFESAVLISTIEKVLEERRTASLA
jgi:CheY-like chemotaxis protein